MNLKIRRSIAVFGVVFGAIGLGRFAMAVDAKTEKPYPLDTCLVTDEKLGGMGEPYVIQFEGREIKFCCKHCEKSFRKDSAKYLAKLDATTRPATQPATQPSE